MIGVTIWYAFLEPLGWKALWRRKREPSPVFREAGRGAFGAHRNIPDSTRVCLCAARRQAMEHASRQMHHRAVAVALAGVVLGVVAQASLITASDRSRTFASSETLTVGHPRYSAGDISLACASIRSRSRRCGFDLGNSSMEIADRGPAAAAN